MDSCRNITQQFMRLEDRNGENFQSGGWAEFLNFWDMTVVILPFPKMISQALLEERATETVVEDTSQDLIPPISPTPQGRGHQQE